jgi:hypothetical protein
MLSGKEVQEIEDKKQQIDPQLNDSISECSSDQSLESGYTSSEFDNSYMEEFQDVEPVKGKEAKKLNESVIARMKVCMFCGLYRDGYYFTCIGCIRRE